VSAISGLHHLTANCPLCTSMEKVVLDNARIHQAAEPILRMLCSLKGAKLEFLPPYSPVRLAALHSGGALTHACAFV